MTSENECVFCRELKSHQNINDFLRDHGDESDKGIKHEYTVAIVIRTWNKDRGKRHAVRTTDYRYRGIGYKLNFCPECGRDLRRRSK